MPQNDNTALKSLLVKFAQAAPEDFIAEAGRIAARRERRRRLMKAISAIGAAGVGAYLANRAYSRYAGGGANAESREVPVVTPAHQPRQGRGILPYLAIPAGVGLAALGGKMALPAMKLPKAVFGRRIANLARKNGLFSVYDNTIKNRFLNGMHDVLKTFGISRSKTPEAARRMGRVFEGDKIPKGAVKSFDFSPATKNPGRNTVGAVSTAKARKMWDNKEFQRKMLEAAGAKGLMPEVLSGEDKKWLISQLARDAKAGHAGEINDKYINRLLKQRTGKDWFIKELKNTSSRDARDMLFQKGYFKNLRSERDFAAQFKDVTINEFRQSEDMPGWLRRFYKTKLYKKLIAKHLPEADNFGYGYRTIPRREFRIHVANGKVIPFATSDRNDPLKTWSTFRTRDKARLEKVVQDAFDKMVDYQKKHPSMKGFKPGELDLRKQVFGLDIAFDKAGKPVIYELNPTMPMNMHAGSGHLLYPEHLDSYRAAVKGRMPLTQVIQLLGGGGTAAAGVGLAANGARGVSDGDK